MDLRRRLTREPPRPSRRAGLQRSRSDWVARAGRRPTPRRRPSDDGRARPGRHAAATDADARSSLGGSAQRPAPGRWSPLFVAVAASSPAGRCCGQFPRPSRWSCRASRVTEPAPDPCSRGARTSTPPGGARAPRPDRSLVVDVTGKVRRPGIVELPPGSRVVDALKAAGGARRSADTSALNLARLLVDGEQIVVGVGRPGERTRGRRLAGRRSSAGGTPQVNLNTATAESSRPSRASGRSRRRRSSSGARSTALHLRSTSCWRSRASVTPRSRSSKPMCMYDAAGPRPAACSRRVDGVAGVCARSRDPLGASRLGALLLASAAFVAAATGEPVRRRPRLVVGLALAASVPAPSGSPDSLRLGRGRPDAGAGGGRRLRHGRGIGGHGPAHVARHVRRLRRRCDST